MPSRACAPPGSARRRKTFPALFRLWHGREPEEGDWPKPSRAGHGGYGWQAPELALLASLVGRLSKPEIAQVLTERLRRLTGDSEACRSLHAVQVAIGRIGLQAGDVVGGITVAKAGAEIGSLAMVHQAIRKGELRASRVGRLWVIPHDAWAAWKKGRTFPPDGYVSLASLKQPLAIRSDKLSEYARLGYVPTAQRCNPFGTGLHSTQFGTWYLAPDVAAQLIADRQAGRPMPWHGKPLAENLRVTWRLWQTRKHPAACATCASIWGEAGAPRSFDVYAERYPPLAHGAKRHLTRPWSAGLTLAEVAAKAGRRQHQVGQAIANGTLIATGQGTARFVSKTDATRWISRGCPSGASHRSWISLATAAKRFLFSERQLGALIAEGKLRSKTGTEGAMRGIVTVSATQCAKVRETIGFTEAEAARRAGVSVGDFRAALTGVHWRGTGAIPLVTVQAVIKRLKARPGHTIAEVVALLGRDMTWIEARIADGTVRPLLRRWNKDERYLSIPMIERLRVAAKTAPKAAPVESLGLRLSAAAREAGVTTSTLQTWAEAGDVPRLSSPTGWRYPPDAIRARARLYWQRHRQHRAQPPAWFREEERKADERHG